MPEEAPGAAWAAPQQTGAIPIVGFEGPEPSSGKPRSRDGESGDDFPEVRRRASPSGLGDFLRIRGGRPHSGLGIASFIIALLVGGMDVLLILIVALNIASSARQAQPPYSYGLSPGENIKANALGGALSVVCLNFMSVPVCLVGLGLGLVALIAHRERNQLFSWIGLLGNGVVILAVVGLFVLASLPWPGH
jgi:hypothetical protein